MDDLAVDRTSGNILLFVRKAKGDQRRAAADKPLIQLPTVAIPLLADLLGGWSKTNDDVTGKYIDHAMSEAPA
jgi:hypothetical protein